MYKYLISFVLPYLTWFYPDTPVWRTMTWGVLSPSRLEPRAFWYTRYISGVYQYILGIYTRCTYMNYLVSYLSQKPVWLLMTIARSHTIHPKCCKGWFLSPSKGRKKRGGLHDPEIASQEIASPWNCPRNCSTTNCFILKLLQFPIPERVQFDFITLSLLLRAY